MEKTRKRCDFDLCSDCVKKNNEAGNKNACSRGHQLYPTVNTGPRGWVCDECGKPPQNIDPDVLTWRCQHDKRVVRVSPSSTTTTTDQAETHMDRNTDNTWLSILPMSKLFVSSQHWYKLSLKHFYSRSFPMFSPQRCLKVVIFLFILF